MVNCPSCGAQETLLKSVELQSDQKNQFGRRQLTFQAEHEEIVKWNPEKRKFHCGNCEIDFSFTEGVMQKLQEALNAQ